MNSVRTRGMRSGVLCALFLTVFFFYASSSFGSDDSALLKAAERVAAGRGNPADEALLFMENRRVNHLAMEGKLDGSVYQKTQAVYDGKNRALAADAAREAGFATEVGGKKIYKPGTDTDIQMTGGDLTAADVERTRQAYNKRVEAYLRGSGLKTEEGVNWAARTETDIVPAPSRMKSEAEFAKAAALINGDGGNMYVSPLAAGAQAKLDAGDPLSVAEGQAYAEEMKTKVEKLKQAKADLAERYRASGIPAERDMLAAEIRKAESHEAKYIERINRLERSLRSASGETAPLLGAAGARGPDALHRRAEAAVDAMSGHLTEKALRNYADTLGDLAVSAQSTARRAVLREAIAGTLKGLPPARQGDALASIEARLGGGFAKEVATEMKKSATGGKIAAPGTNLLKGAGILSTLLAGYNAMAEENKRTSGNPDYGRTALNFAYDMILRATVDAASRDTAEYTKKRVEELKEYYRSRGQDPESLAVKMKIAAEASLKGTAYGTVKGAYELAKLSGKWAGGAIVGGAETVIFLAGEALETLNTLEVSGATLREQGMAQEVQDAKSVASGRELVGELRRMSALAASQRSLLEQNIRWARSLDIHRSRALDDLRSRLEEAAQVSLSNVEQLAEEAAKRYPPEFKRLAEYSTVIHSKITAVEKALAGGKSALAVAGDIKFIVAEHGGNLDGFKTLAEGMKEFRRMEYLADLADTLAALPEEKNAIAALGEEAGNGAAVMKRNYDTWRKAISEYDRLKYSLGRGSTYFYGKRRVAGWLVIKSDADAVPAPDRTIPEEFGPELGTLQRMKTSIVSDLRRLPRAKGDEQRFRSTLERIKKTYNALLPGYEAARESLEKTNLALEKLLALIGAAPSPTPAEEKASPTPDAGGENAVFGLRIPLDLHGMLLEMTGLTGIPEGAHKRREDVENGYYLTEETLNTDYLIVFLTPDKKEVKVSLKGTRGLPDPGQNRFLALAGTIAYSKKKSVVGYYLDFKNNKLERSPQGVYEGIVVMNYSVFDAKATDDPTGTLEFHAARFGLGKGTTPEMLKGMGKTVLEAGRFRISKQGSGDKDGGTWVYGAVIGDFVVNVSFNRRSLRPDTWSPPFFEPDEVVLALLEQLFP